MEELKSAVLLDIENLVIAVSNDLRDRGVKTKVKDIAKLLLELIVTIAAGHGQIKFLLGAVSLPQVTLNSGGDEGGKNKAKKEILATAEVFTDGGFEVTMKSSAKNAADLLLKKLAREPKEDSEVGEVFLCSGDGRWPFPEIVNELQEAGKRVTAIVYDKVPEGLRNADSFVLLDQHVHLQLEENVESGSPVIRQRDTSLKNVEELPKNESLENIYRNIIKEIQDGMKPQSTIYFERLCRALSFLEKYFRRASGFSTLSTFRLIATLEREFPEFAKGEHRTLFYAILDNTDFFYKSPHFGFETESKFLAKLLAKS